RHGGKVSVVHHIEAVIASCRQIVMQKTGKLRVKAVHGAHVGKLCDPGAYPEGVFLTGGGDAVTGAREYVHLISGHRIVGILGHDLTFAKEKPVLVMEMASFFD